MMNTMTKAREGGKGLPYFTIPSPWGGEKEQELKAGTWRQKLKQFSQAVHGGLLKGWFWLIATV